jgi:hypothetical protein
MHLMQKMPRSSRFIPIFCIICIFCMKLWIYGPAPRRLTPSAGFDRAFSEPSGFLQSLNDGQGLFLVQALGEAIAANIHDADFVAAVCPNPAQHAPLVGTPLGQPDLA